MINFSISGSLSEAIKSQLNKYDLPSGDKVARIVATSLLPEMRYRIHQQGLDASDQPIGVYKNSYLQLRQKKYNRTSDPKVIASLTRQMENDFSVIPQSENAYGLGYKNPVNAGKAEHLETKYKKKIFELTQKEQDLIPRIVETEIQNAPDE